ncbi:hypothetical protein [Dokdonia sp.]|uniref:hypothetical protein n=1 Tax=Dokdonia sp. TaxID=2024995 RepID=UPI003265903F
MITAEKEQEAKEMLDTLYGRIDDGGLNTWEQSIFDTLTWLFEDTDKPELD